MSLIQLIVAVGVAAGSLAVLIVILFERFRKHIGDKTEPSVPKTVVGGLGIGNIDGPMAVLARRGQDAPARMSLNAVIMTPTKGLRFISLGSSALILLAIWHPVIGIYSEGLSLCLLLTAGVAYGALYTAGYEAKYDSEGLTVPNWLFMDKTHKWEDFISIKDDGHYLYQLRFVTGKVAMQKYLVGMPTFTTFVADVKKLSASV